MIGLCCCCCVVSLSASVGVARGADGLICGCVDCVDVLCVHVSCLVVRCIDWSGAFRVVDVMTVLRCSC